MTMVQIALALATFAGLVAVNTAFLLDKKSKEIDRLYECVNRLTRMIKDIDPQFAEERAILAAETLEDGFDGWAMTQIEQRKRAEGKPLYYDPLIPHEDRR